MKLFKSIAKIDGKDPGEIIPETHGDLAFLLRHEAIRELTEAEYALEMLKVRATPATTAATTAEPELPLDSGPAKSSDDPIDDQSGAADTAKTDDAGNAATGRGKARIDDL